jgi:dUTP pyrophosphatase
MEHNAVVRYYSEWEKQLNDANTVLALNAGYDMPLKSKETDPKLFYGTPFAAGIDIPFYDPELEEVTIEPGKRTMLKTGMYVEMPSHVFGLLDSRSSTSKLLLDLLCRTIDCDYRGNIRTVVINMGDEPITVRRGEYLFQLILVPRIYADLQPVGTLEELTATERGEQGFGHTGNSQAAQGGSN